METMYDRIKQMSESEMKAFVYWVYFCGNEDGSMGLCDSPNGYFGNILLDQDVNEVMPNGNTNDLWDLFKKVYRKGKEV